MVESEPRQRTIPAVGRGQATGEIRFRRPAPRDAAAVWELVRRSRTLDVNSPYAYLLVCSEFAETSVIAEAGGEIVGFVAAFRPPQRREAVFVWQIAVAERERGRGVGYRLLEQTVRAARARFLEATVTPSNRLSRSMFEGFARRRAVACRESSGFGAELFPGAEHEPEVRLCIGPFTVDETKEKPHARV
jgi:L-2,4-diaminobutyric acid acetyltransferase